MEPVSIEFDGYLITTDKRLMNLGDIHKWLSEEAYWSKGIPYETVSTQFENSFCIGAIIGNRQIAFARLVTDYAIFGYLADVYVIEAHRGKGISRQMMDMLFGLDWVRGLRRVMLKTTNAHGLYRKYGFTECKASESLMEFSPSTDLAGLK
jgi:GNAT superfamily N-acetyltransferase